MFNFSITLDNVGLNVDTYFGSLALPLNTILAIVFVVAGLRVRKVLLNRKANQVVETPEIKNPFTDFDFS